MHTRSNSQSQVMLPLVHVILPGHRCIWLRRMLEQCRLLHVHGLKRLEFHFHQPNLWVQSVNSTHLFRALPRQLTRKTSKTHLLLV